MAQKKISTENAKLFARDYVEYLRSAHHLPIKQAYLFGSYARKQPRDWSDIDVCIISTKFQRTDPLTYLWTRRRSIDVDRGIEPYGLDPDDFVVENPIASEIRRYGVPLLAPNKI